MRFSLWFLFIAVTWLVVTIGCIRLTVTRSHWKTPDAIHVWSIILGLGAIAALFTANSLRGRERANQRAQWAAQSAYRSQTMSLLDRIVLLSQKMKDHRHAILAMPIHERGEMIAEYDLMVDRMNFLVREFNERETEIVGKLTEYKRIN